MPTYQCNGTCAFCYLGKQVKQTEVLSLHVLQEKLWSIDKRYQCNLNIEVFGGEITLLDYQYVRDLLKLCNQYSFGDVGIVTNLTNVEYVKQLIDDGVPVAVSWNEERGRVGKKAMSNLLSLDNKYRSAIDLQIVCLPSVIKQGAQSLLDMVESLCVRSVTILQYYPAVQSKKQYSVNNEQYQQFMLEFVDIYNNNDYTFKVGNLDLWKSRYDCKQSSNIFIAPNGKYAVTVYDQDGKESFEYFDDLKTYDDICSKELVTYVNKCITCRLFNNCLAEHLRFDQQTVCCGLPALTQYVQSKL